MTHRRSRRRHRLRSVLGPMLAVLCGWPGVSQASEIALKQLHRTQWTVQGGAPSGITDMAQTRDGYMWLASNGRLFRFDGVEFERIREIGDSPLPASRIHTFWPRTAGGLWISYLFGGATFIGDDGTARSYSVGEGLPPNTVTSFAEGADGRMWAGTSRGMLWLDGGRWKPAEDSWRIPQHLISLMRLDREGTLWVLTDDALYFQRNGARHFELVLQTPGERLEAYFVPEPDNRFWLRRTGFGLAELRLPEPGQPLALDWRPLGSDPRAPWPAFLIDRESNLWLSNEARVTRVPLRIRAAAAQGTGDLIGEGAEHVLLPGDHSGPLFQDREGNVWAVSSGGLAMFRPSAFVKVELDRSPRGTAALAADDDGSVWISEFAGSLHRYQAGVKQETVPSPHPPFAVVHRDHAGTLWVGGRPRSIHHRRGDQWIEWQPEDVEGGGGVQALVSQPDGTLWASIARVGVYRVVDNRWTLWGGLAGLPEEPATAMAIDRAGRLWLGYIGSRIAVVDQGHVTVYDSADGLSTGAVQVIAVRGRGMWVGGEMGLARFDGTRFQTIRGGREQTFGNVSGIMERAQGELWLNTSDGAVLIPADEVRQAEADPGHPVEFRLFDHLDGMLGAPGYLRPAPTAVESTDGRLWFSTYDGVVSLAPEPFVRNVVVPSVYIKSITADGDRTNVEGPGRSILRLAAKPQVLRIAYTAPSFTIPERVRFRYRLVGSQMDWEDVGSRREAFFTGLPPGSYRFHVTAANDSGLWNDTGASLEFVIPPTFLQSRTFLVMCVAIGLAAMWLLVVLRMRRVKAKLQWRSEARLLERERIARDLHDTFLQGVHGLMLRFQSATERIPENEPARALMEDALDRADRVLADGREKVSDLRASGGLNLPEGLAMAGNELSRDYAVVFSAQVEGDLRELDPLVQEEAYRIGAEALTNAFRHAAASRIGVTAVFGRRQLEIRVTDDGCGFDVTSVRKGRWGLQGLRERAAKIRGRIRLASKPGTGTTVELLVPARIAYRNAGDGRRGWRRILAGFRGERST